MIIQYHNWMHILNLLSVGQKTVLIHYSLASDYFLWEHLSVIMGKEINLTFNVVCACQSLIL